MKKSLEFYGEQGKVNLVITMIEDETKQPLTGKPLTRFCKPHTSATKSVSPAGRDESRAAFTLAEVLITLGIIGIVAAMTLPTLIHKYEEKTTVTKLKESYSMLNQAYTMAVANNESPEHWTFGDRDMDHAQTHIDFANYFKPYLKLSEDCIGKSDSYIQKHCAQNRSVNSTTHAYLVLANGYSLIFRAAPNTTTVNIPGTKVLGLITVFNQKSRTIENGKNVFGFYFTNKGVIPRGQANDTYKFEKACNPNIEKPYPNFSSTNMFGCAAWVIYNENMDYLKCPGELSWEGKHRCSDK